LPWVNSFVSDIVNDEKCFYARKGNFGNEIINKLEGSLNPQMMMNELELSARNKGVLFLSGIEVREIVHDEQYILTNLGKMDFKKLIVCTNGFSSFLLPKQDVKPARNQVLITNKIPGLNLDCCYHMNKGFVYFRAYDGRILIGGGRDLDKENETTDQMGTTVLITDYLKEILQKHILPNQTFSIEHSWSGILGVGETKMPIVEMIDKNVLIAVRMGGMGVAIGSFIGRVAASMLMSNDNSALQLYVN
jgi:glycine/D-amino acid oxidase-like deaminating enzyme